MWCHFFVLLFSSLLLIGCAGDSSKTKVTGLCGSCKPYYVRGSMHYPQTHYEYDEEGLASWYGPGFHGKPKPLGEKFNQHTMTAAHKTLPLPTIVRVTNLENGKAITVLVDDRGPFVYQGRIIDLSMEAAKRLGSYAKGTVRVRVQSLVPESKALADYLAQNGHRQSKDRLKRTWLQIYEQEIHGRPLEGAGVGYESKSEFIKKPKHVPTIKSAKLAKPILQPTVNKAATLSTKPYIIKLKQSFSDKSQAAVFAKKLKNELPSKVVSEKLKNGKIVWRIHVGPFTDALNTETFKKRIRTLVG